MFLFFDYFCRKYKTWLATEYTAARAHNKEIDIPSWFWPDSLSRSSGQLLVRLLHYDPHMRLSAEQVLRQAWCRNLPDGAHMSNTPDAPSSESVDSHERGYSAHRGAALGQQRILFPEEALFSSEDSGVHSQPNTSLATESGSPLSVRSKQRSAERSVITPRTDSRSDRSRVPMVSTISSKSRHRSKQPQPSSEHEYPTVIYVDAEGHDDSVLAPQVHALSLDNVGDGNTMASVVKQESKVQGDVR